MSPRSPKTIELSRQYAAAIETGGAASASRLQGIRYTGRVSDTEPSYSEIHHLTSSTNSIPDNSDNPEFSDNSEFSQYRDAEFELLAASGLEEPSDLVTHDCRPFTDKDATGEARESLWASG
jgi:hypothetical protein